LEDLLCGSTGAEPEYQPATSAQRMRLQSSMVRAWRASAGLDKTVFEHDPVRLCAAYTDTGVVGLAPGKRFDTGVSFSSAASPLRSSDDASERLSLGTPDAPASTRNTTSPDGQRRQ